VSDGPKFVPDFQEVNSGVYKAEYGAITLALVAYLIWRGFSVGGIDLTDCILDFVPRPYSIHPHRSFFQQERMAELGSYFVQHSA